MAINITVAELLSALRMGASTEETAEATRLLGYATQTISDYLGTAYEGTASEITNEAAVRLAGYLFDQPYASRGTSFAASLANSGAGSILLPYRVHRAGSVAEAASLAVASGSVGNPVIGLSIIGNDLIVEFADGTTADVPLPAAVFLGNPVVNLSLAGTVLTVTHVDASTEEITLPAGGMSGVDQQARDSASDAQSDADAAQGTANNAATAAAAAADIANANTGRLDAFPAGTGGVDQTARDAADGAQTAADDAQSDADAAQAEIGAHERAPHNTDITARDAAAAAQGTADGAQAAAAAAQAEIDTHEATPHNTDGPARTAAAAAQGTADDAQAAAAAAEGAIAAHERAPHNTDGTARTAAEAAQDRADDAFALADGKVDPAGATSAAREAVADWAEEDNPDPIPAPKLVNVVNAHEDIVNVLDGRLPGLPVAMRLGWSQTRTFTELDFDRPLPPLGGSIAGMSDRLAAPPFPPGLASDPTLFFGIWLSGDPDVVEISGGGAQFGNKLPLTIADGKVGGNPGHYVVSTARLRPLEGTIFSVTITGPRLVLESELFAHVSDPNAHHVPPDTPPPGMGGGPAVLYEAASVAIGASTGLIAGNVVCPPAGALEFYFEGLTGTRQGGVAYARVPAPRIRGAVSALDATYSNDTSNMLLISHGANRGIGVSVQATTNFLLLAAQAPGNFYVRIAHSEIP